MTTPTPTIAAFHAHLDGCRRCEQQPFNLCPVGARLLRAATEDVAALLGALRLPTRTCRDDTPGGR